MIDAGFDPHHAIVGRLLVPASRPRGRPWSQFTLALVAAEV
jgi:hypothetical protein